jgi:heme-degrading monooxygenase HmoA
MAKVFAHHKVADYAKWRKVFDEMTALRTSFGSTGQSVMRSASDPNEIVVITEWLSVDKARAFSQSPDLKEAMQKGGVISQPEVLFLEEA